MKIDVCLKTNKKTTISADLIIIALLLISIPIDALNGYLLRNDIFSIALPYRAIIMGLMIYRLTFSRIENLVFLTLIPLFFCLQTLIYIINIDDFGTNFFINNAVYYSRVAFTPIVFVYFINYLRNNDIRILKTIILTNSLAMMLFILIGIVGFGYAQYRGEVGTRSFFYAGNDMSLAFVVLSVLLLGFIWNHGKRINYFLAGLLSIVFSVFIATRVAMIGILLSVVLLPLFYNRRIIKRLKGIKFKHIIYTILFCFLCFYLIYQIAEHTGIIDRYRYHMKGTDTISFLLSHRNVFLADAMRVFVNDYNFLDYLWGRGFDPDIKMVEIDFFDILMSYGFIGVIVIFSFWFYLLYLSFKKYSKNYNSYCPAVFLINIIVFVIMFSAGHVVDSAMAGIFIALANAMIFDKTNQPISWFLNP